MTAFATLMALSAVAAACDWVAVATSNTLLEYAAKPSVLATLVAAAAAIPAAETDLVDRRWWFVAALSCCLVGDVLLMLPRDRFTAGLGAFLVGHFLYIGGLLQAPSSGAGAPFSFSAAGLAAATIVVVAIEAVPATLILRALIRGRRAELLGPVLVYMAAIVTMVVLATNVANVVAAVGAVCFLVSDTVLALDRFVAPLPRGTLAVHVTYHLGQGLLVLSLLR